MQEEKNNYLLPGAIVIAGLIIAGSIFVRNTNSDDIIRTRPTDSKSIKEISLDDKILGNPNAPIVIVEYSDMECPFCKRFHEIMHSVINTYGKDGKVAWVYRHFPLDSLHKKSRKEAEATECAYNLGGNDSFWKVLDTIYTKTTSNDGLDLSLLPKFAKDASLNVSDFNKCLDSGETANIIEKQLRDGVSAGIQGTPYSVAMLKSPITEKAKDSIENFVSENNLNQNIIVSQDGKQIVISGALPLEILKIIFDAILK